MCYNGCSYFNVWLERCRKPKRAICPDEFELECDVCGCPLSDEFALYDEETGETICPECSELPREILRRTKGEYIIIV